MTENILGSQSNTLHELNQEKQKLEKRAKKFDEAYQIKKGTPLWIIKSEKEYLVREKKRLEDAIEQFKKNNPKRSK